MERFPSVVSDIMSKLVTIESTGSVKEAAERMLEKNIGSIIITKDGKPAGIVTKSDLLARVIVDCRDPRECPVADIMSSPLLTIDKDTPILEAMRVIKQKKVRRLLVSDGDELVGIISEADMINAVTVSSLTQFSSLLRKK